MNFLDLKKEYPILKMEGFSYQKLFEEMEYFWEKAKEAAPARFRMVVLVLDTIMSNSIEDLEKLNYTTEGGFLKHVEYLKNDMDWLYNHWIKNSNNIS